MLKRWVVSWLLLITLNITYGQEMLGITTSNLAGTNGIQLNPASMVNSKLYFDVNLVTVNGFFENNYLYIPPEDFNLFNFIPPNVRFPEYGPEKRPFKDYFPQQKTKTIYGQMRVNGPSAMFNYRGQAFALTTAARVVGYGYNMPFEMMKFIYEGIDYPPQFNQNYKTDSDFRMGGLAWTEIGLSYARVLHKFDHHLWSGGFTLKYLLGSGGGYFNVYNLDYMLPNQDTIIAYNVLADGGFAAPIHFNKNEYTGNPFPGRGIGMDIGITYQRMKKGYTNRYYRKVCREPYYDYLWRVGVSLLDVGRIRFKKSALEMEWDDVSTVWTDVQNIDFNNVNDLIHQMSDRFYGGDTTKFVKSQQIDVYLPTALSVQGDVHLSEPWYVAGVWMQGLPIGQGNIRRPSQLAVVPRYERALFELSLPVSVYDYEKVRIGFALRLLNLTVGTDKIGAIMGYNDFTGMDIYFSWRINFLDGTIFDFVKGHCRSKNMGIECANFEYN